MLLKISFRMDCRGTRRYAVLFRLPGLKFLDFQAVKQPELAEAKKRGKFTAVAKPKGAASAGGAAASAEVNPCATALQLLGL